MPGYGISEAKKGILPWSWARRRLENNRNYWISTVRPDGRPHAMPVWGLWHKERLFFSTAITSVKARNLLASPACTATTENGAEAVIVEGRAVLVSDRKVLAPVWAAYKAKYDWPMDGEDMFALKPTAAFAFIETADRFSTTATRWLFS
jgi:general stress protein 26